MTCVTLDEIENSFMVDIPLAISTLHVLRHSDDLMKAASSEHDGARHSNGPDLTFSYI